MTRPRSIRSSTSILSLLFSRANQDKAVSAMQTKATDCRIYSYSPFGSFVTPCFRLFQLYIICIYTDIDTSLCVSHFCFFLPYIPCLGHFIRFRLQIVPGIFFSHVATVVVVVSFRSSRFFVCLFVSTLFVVLTEKSLVLMLMAYLINVWSVYVGSALWSGQHQSWIGNGTHLATIYDSIIITGQYTYTVLVIKWKPRHFP